MHRERRWRELAYVTRYGMQPLSEVLALPLPDFAAYKDALEWIVGLENKPVGGGS